jgi:hypothetical protein
MEAAPTAYQPKHPLSENDNRYQVQGDRREVEKTYQDSQNIGLNIFVR